MRIKPLIAGSCALLLSMVIDVTVVTPHIYIDKIIDIPLPSLKAVAIMQPLQAPVYQPFVQVAAIAVAAPVPPVVAPVAPVVAPKVVSSCGDNSYANYIYEHESGCRLDAVNSIGACGIGQALPCSKMPCGLADYICQNNWFTNYMQSRYGSWQAAYNYWVIHQNW
jgi:hypothetical protein